MAFGSLGKVTITAAGTPERITKNQGTPTARVGAQTIIVTVPSGNTGANFYLGTSALNKGTGAGVYAVIPKGTTQQFAIPSAPAGFDCSVIYGDVDTTNDAAFISYIEQ